MKVISASVHVISSAVYDLFEDEAFRMSAAVAFYSISSLAPALVIVVAIVRSIYQGDTEGEMLAYISQYVGQDTARLVTRAVSATARSASAGMGPAIASVATTLLAATAAFAELQRSMNRVWEIERIELSFTDSVKVFFRNRLVGFIMVLFIAALMWTSMILNAGLSVYGSYLERYTARVHYFWPYVEMISAFGILVLVFAAIFKWVPDARIEWRDVWVGAVITAILFTLGKTGISLYISRSAVGSAYGAAGAVIVILAWIYYSVLILFLGAEITQAYVEQAGRRVSPKSHAAYLPQLENQQSRVNKEAA